MGIKQIRYRCLKDYIKSLLKKMFYIGNSYKGTTKYKVMRICGITIKHKINATKKIEKFVKANDDYLNRTDKKIKKRLFLTTGSISLLNNLTIIKQLNESDCEDVLFILSHIKNPAFSECCKKIARRHYCDYKKVKKIMMLNYLNKIDFFGLEESNMNKIVPLDKELFLEVSTKCAEMFPVNLNLKPNEKAVIFCGTWWEGSGLSKEQYFEFQDGTIEKLISLGYKVFFKPHPRDPRNYINNPNISILKTALPLECYNFNIEAVVSLVSLVTLHIPYFRNIPGFTIPVFNKIDKEFEFYWLDVLVKKITEKYTTPIDELLSVNPKLYTKQELKNMLQIKCEKYIDSLPLLSQNKEIEQFARLNGYFDDFEMKINNSEKELVLSGGKK